MHRVLNPTKQAQEEQRHFQWLLSGSNPYLQWFFTVIIFVAVIFTAYHISEERDFLELIETAQPLWIIAGLIFQVGTYYSQSYVWKTGLEKTGHKFRANELIGLSFAQLFINQVIPTFSVSGALFVTKALGQRGVPHRDVSVTLGLSLISYWLAYTIAIVAGLVILTFQHHVDPAVSIPLVIILIVFCFIITKFSKGFSKDKTLKMIKRLHLRKFAFIRNFIHVLEDMDLKRLSGRVIAQATFYQLIEFVLDFMTLWTMLKALGLNANLGSIFASYMTAYLARSIGILPGGIGIFEAAAITSLHYSGISVAGALAGTLLFRGLSYWIPMIPGLFLVRREFSHSNRIRSSKIEIFWQIKLQDLYQRLRSRPDGLSTEESRKRLILNGPNQIHEQRVPVLWEIFWNQLRSPLVLLLAGAAIISFFLSDWTDAVIIFVILFTGTSIGSLREREAYLILQKLKAELALKAKVFRDGIKIILPAENLVPGDVIYLSAGDLVPADVVVLESQDCYVNEASITGESFPVLKKNSDDTTHDKDHALFLGSHVQTGSAKCLVINTGPATLFGLLAQSVQRSPPLTDFDKNINAFGYMIVKIMLLIVVLVFAVKTFVSGLSMDSLMFSVALAVGLSPELLPLIINYDLAVGAKRLAERGLIVRHPKAIENLGAVDILCSDKSGTITEGVVNFEGACDAWGETSKSVLEYAWINAVYQTGMENPLDQVLSEAIRPEEIKVIKRGEIPYDFKRKRLSVLIERDHKLEIITKGAFDKILEVCTHDERGEFLDEKRRKVLEGLFAEWSRQGERVLGVARREIARETLCERSCEEGMIFLGFLRFQDRPREHVLDILRELGDLGIGIKIITGDNSLVTQAIAEKVGLDPLQILEGKDLENISNEALPVRARDIQLFTQVDPQQKERIIHALRKLGHTVAYMGDGINDVSAMHVSDVSISVASAADVTKSTADIVLKEKSLEFIKNGVQEGRTTFQNSLKYINITMSANLGNMISMAIASVFLPFLPLLAGQILLNNLLSDVPAFGLAQDNVDPDVIRKPTRWNLDSILNFMIVFGLVSTVFDMLTFYVLLNYFKADVTAFRTAWFTESLLTELFVRMVLRTMHPKAKSRPTFKLVALTFSMAFITLVISYLPGSSFLGFAPMKLTVLMVVILITLTYLFVTEIAKELFVRHEFRNRRIFFQGQKT